MVRHRPRTRGLGRLLRRTRGRPATPPVRGAPAHEEALLVRQCRADALRSRDRGGPAGIGRRAALAQRHDGPGDTDRMPARLTRFLLSRYYDARCLGMPPGGATSGTVYAHTRVRLHWAISYQVKTDGGCMLYSPRIIGREGMGKFADGPTLFAPAAGDRRDAHARHAAID